MESDIYLVVEETDAGWVWGLTTPQGEPIVKSVFPYDNPEQAEAAFRGIEQALQRN